MRKYNSKLNTKCALYLVRAIRKWRKGKASFFSVRHFPTFKYQSA